MKIFAKNLIAFISFMAVVAATPVLAREKEIETGDDKRPKVEVLGLASFKEAMADFKKARTDFFETEKKFVPDTSFFQELKTQLPGGVEVEKIAPVGAERETAAPILAEPKAAKLVLKAAEVLIERNKEILETVEKQSGIYLGDKVIVPAVNNEIKKLEALKNEVKTNAKLETVKSVTRELKTVRARQIEVKEAIIIPHLMGFEMGPLKVAGMRKEKTAASLNELKNQGKDTGALESKIKQAEAKLTLIKADLNRLKIEVLKTTLKTDLERLRDEIKLVYKIFEEVAILGQSL